MTFIHPSAEVQSEHVGEGTSIWQGCVVLAGAVIGKDCNINAHCLIERGAVLGDRVTIKCGVYVWEGVTLADDVFVGPNATFTNDRAPRSKRRPPVFQKTRVGNGASIGAAAVLVSPVVVGAYALIGAGSVVTNEVLPHSLVAGNPARHLAWVCACGSRLPESLKCLSCGIGFELRNGRLEHSALSP